MDSHTNQSSDRGQVGAMQLSEGSPFSENKAFTSKTLSEGAPSSELQKRYSPAKAAGRKRPRTEVDVVDGSKARKKSRKAGEQVVLTELLAVCNR